MPTVVKYPKMVTKYIVRVVKDTLVDGVRVALLDIMVDRRQKETFVNCVIAPETLIQMNRTLVIR